MTGRNVREIMARLEDSIRENLNEALSEISDDLLRSTVADIADDLSDLTGDRVEVDINVREATDELLALLEEEFDDFRPGTVVHKDGRPHMIVMKVEEQYLALDLQREHEGVVEVVLTFIDPRNNIGMGITPAELRKLIIAAENPLP